MDLKIAIVDNMERFRELKNEWDLLIKNAGHVPITMTWEWMFTWWAIYNKDRCLRILTAYDGEELVGIAPLLKKNQSSCYFSMFKFNTMELLASGEDHGSQVGSEYLEFITKQGRTNEVLGSFIRFIVNDLREDWEEIVLHDVSSGSPLVKYLKTESPNIGIEFRVEKVELTSCVRLPVKWQDFLEDIGSNLRYKIRRGRKELAGLKGEYVAPASWDEVLAIFEEMVRLHQIRWIAKNKPGAWGNPQRLAFHKALLPLVYERGWLMLRALKTNGGIIAVNYNFNYGNRIFFYQSGLEIQNNMHLRPGLLLHSYCIEEAIACGVSEYDFLKRGKSDYKDEWSNAEREVVRIRIYRPSQKEFLFHLVCSGVSTARAIKNKAEKGVRELRRKGSNTENRRET